jgi:gas vesicle protein
MSNRTYYSRDAEMQVAREKTIMTLIFLAVGLAVGTAVALLFAPASGKKTRDELGNVIEEGLNSGREAVEPTLKRLEHDFADLRKRVDSKINDLR